MPTLPLVLWRCRGRFFAVMLATLGVAGRAGAEIPPFQLNPDRIKIASFGGTLVSPTKTYFVPTATIIVSASGSVWAQAKGGGGSNAQAHAKFYVRGLDKELLQDLARQVQDDLVTKLRAAGYTVLTYDDLKSHPLIAGHSRDEPDAKWHLPTKHKDPNVYLLANPTDAQAFDQPITGPLFWMQGVMKEKQIIAIVPELTFVTPVVWGEGTKGYNRAEALINIKPAMKFAGAMTWTANAKGSVNIQIYEHGMRLVSENTGVVKKVDEESYNFTSSWGRSSADYVFTLDQKVFAAGVLRVAGQVNDYTVAQIAKAKK